MGNYDAEVRVSTKVDTSQMQRLQLQIDKAVQKVDVLTKKYDELKNKRMPTEAYAELESKLASAKALLVALIAEEEKLSSAGLAIGAPWDNVIQKEADAQLKIEAIQAEMQKLVATGKAFTIGANPAEINNAANELSRAKSELRMLVTKQSELGAKSNKVSDGLKRIGAVGKKAFGEMNGQIRKSGGLLSTFASRLKGIALSLLVFNWVSKGFNAMVAGIKEGFKNLVQYSDEYNRSISSLQSANAQLKNSFAAAFAPIIQMVIPYLVQLIGYVTSAINAVAQFIAILSGKTTWTKATAVQKNYAASLNGTAAAAKKAAGALARFDDLDVLSKTNTDEGSGGGAGGIDPGSMFEEVPVDSKFKDWLDGILEKLKPLLDYLKKLGRIFMDGFWDGLGDYQYRLDIIKKGLEQIKKALIDIFTDPAVIKAAQGYLESLMYMLGSLAGAIASIALTIAAAFIGGLGDYLEKNVDRIKKYLISMFNIGTEINYLLADLFQSVAYIFEAFASEDGIRFVSALIGSITDAFMGVTEVLMKLGRDILQIIVEPISDNADEFKTALEGLLATGANALEGFKTAIDGIFDNLNAIYDAHFKPFFDSVAEGLSYLVGVFLEVWNGHVSPILQEIGTKIGELFSSYLEPFINAAVELIGNLVTMLQGFWEDIIMPIVDLLLTYVFPVVADMFAEFITGIIEGIENILSGFTTLIEFITFLVEQWNVLWTSAKELFNTFWKSIETILALLKAAFTLFGTFIKSVVNGDWKTAWETAKTIFTTFKDGVTSIVDSIKAYLSAFFTWVGEMISNCLAKIKSIGTSIGNAIGSVFGGGSSGGVSTYTMSQVMAVEDIPHLATGAVIRGGNPFMAVLGDQKFGQTNVETPLSTIEDAVRNVMDENSYSGGNATINLNYDGETFARLFLPDFFSEIHRQGYDLNFNPE